MELMFRKSHREISRLAANLICNAIMLRTAWKNKFNLGLATGGTPEQTYAELVKLHKKSSLTFGAVRTFNLDEYVGLEPDHPQSYQHYMNYHLFDYMDIERANIHFPSSINYDKLIDEAGGIDLQLLGIGRNGHIAFNEPGSSFDSRTRKIRLTDDTRQANARFFNSIDEVPTHAWTMGLATIMKARKIILLADLDSKEEALTAALEGPVTEECPASILQRHPNCIFIVNIGDA